MTVRAGIVGVGQTKYGRRPESSTPELISMSVTEALADAQRSVDDVDAVFVGVAPDALLGVADADQWLAHAVGAVGKPMMRISTGGSTGSSAALAGYAAVRAGVFQTVLAVAVERAGETQDVQALMNTNIDPIFEKSFGLNAINVYALVAVDHMRRHGTTEEHLAQISVRNHRHALRNPFAHIQHDIDLRDVMESRMLAWPIKLYDTCPASDGACAVVISNESARRPSDVPAWITGASTYSDSYYLGDRDRLSYRKHLVLAAEEAYRQADIKHPLHDVDVAELQNPFTSSELVAIEALGFCEVGQAGPSVAAGLGEMDSELPINPSGGSLCSNPVGATSLVRLAEAALQVRGMAGDRQVPGAMKALAQCSGGSVQFGSVFILES